MVRLVGPESGSRLAYAITGTGSLLSAGGAVATVYSDPAATVLADILTLAGDPITGSQVTIGADTQLPRFQFPDGADVLYVRVADGPIEPVYARLADSTASNLAAHEAATTSVHGIANTAALETQTGSAAKVSTHTAASDPHGDRAYAATQAASAQTAAEGYTDSAVAGLAADSTVVHKSGVESIAGVKTFTSAPVVPDASFAVAKLSGLGGAATLNVGTAAGTVAAGDDSRLSDTRTPTDSSVTSAKIADGTIVNADVSATAAIALSKLAADPLARANHTGTQLAATISDFAATASADAPVQSVAGKTGTVVLAGVDIASGTVAYARLPVGMTASTIAAGDDSRLSDTRTPTDNSVTSAKIADGAIVDADINSAAAIALSKLATDPLARANHTGTQLAATISDFASAASSDAPVQSVAGRTGAVVLAGADIASGTVAYARLPVGATTSTVAAGDDSRLSDTRTPTDNSVTSAKIVDGTIVDADINSAAAIANTKLATNPLARANHTGTQLAATISDFSAGVLLTAPPTGRLVSTASLLSGGGDLSADRTLATLGIGPQPDDMAFIDWTFDPQIATSTGSVPSSGLLYVTKFRMRAGKTISTINLMVGATGTQPSNVVGGLYDASGNLITNASGTIAVATWNSTGVHGFSLTTPAPIATGAWYYVGWFVNGSSSPSVLRTNTSGLSFTNNGNLTGTAAGTPATAFRAASANTGQTTSLPSSLGTLSAVPQSWWVAVA